MAKHLQLWLTDDEYHEIEDSLIGFCNDKGCSPSKALKSAVVEYFKSQPAKKKVMI